MAAEPNARDQARVKLRIRANQSQCHGGADDLRFPMRQVNSFDADVISAQALPALTEFMISIQRN